MFSSNIISNFNSARTICYAISGYDSGYSHGCDDAKVADHQTDTSPTGKGQNITLMLLCKDTTQASTLALYNNPIVCHPQTPSSQTPLSPTMPDQGDEASFGIAIIIAILVIVSCIAIAIKKLMRRGKHKREATLFGFSKGECIKKTKSQVRAL